MRIPTLFLSSVLSAFLFFPLAAEDLLVSNFEGKTYQGWLIAGNAFNKDPLRAEQAKKREITGFHGKSFASSNANEDQLTGHLLSPPFKITRKHLNFLIGGGHHPEKIEVQLLIKDQIVRRRTPQINQENLVPTSWDISEFKDQKAQVRIIDQETGNWGHINVDRITQSDTPTPSPKLLAQKAESKPVQPTAKNNPATKPEKNAATRVIEINGKKFPFTSGSVITDFNNSLGLQLGDTKFLFRFLSVESGGKFHQALSYSTDHAKNFKLLNDGKAVLSNQGLSRKETTPTVLWHPRSAQWIMALTGGDQECGTTRFLRSDDLVSWTASSDFKRPWLSGPARFFKMPLQGPKNQSRWVLLSANGTYEAGDFSGERFITPHLIQATCSRKTT